MADEKEVSEIEIRARVVGAESLERAAKAGRTLEGAAIAVISAQEKLDRKTAAATRAFEGLERRLTKIGGALQTYQKGLRVVERAANQTSISEDRLARVKQQVQERFEAAERAIRGQETAYQRLRSAIDPVTKAEQDFANAQDIITKALERGEISAKDNAAELERMRARLDDQRRAALAQEDAYAQLERRLDPLIGAERDLAVALSTVNDALARGRISSERAAQDTEKLRAEFSELKNATSSAGQAYNTLIASLDPIARIQQELASNQETVNAALKDGSIDAAEAARAKKLVADRAEEARAAIASESTAFQQLQDSIDPAIRAEREFAAASKVVSDALEKGETDGVEAARVLGLLEKRMDEAKRAASGATDEYRRFIASLDPAARATQELARGEEIVSAALQRGEIDAVEAARALDLLRQKLAETAAKADGAGTEFQQLSLRIDNAARAEKEFARDSAIVNRALESQEINAEEAARAMRLLQDRYNNTLRGGVAPLSGGIRGLNVAMRSAAALAAAFAGSFVIRKLVEFNDTIDRTTNRLRIVTDSYGELLFVQNRLFESSQRSFTSIEGGVEIYERLSRSTKDLEISNDRLLRVTEAVQKSIALSGTTALAANAAIIQFGQGLAADSLRGQELNSVMEQTPRLARALAEGLGVGLGDLRELANQGLLTTEKVINALEKSAGAIDAEFAKIEPTLAQVTTQAENSATRIGAAFASPIIDQFKSQLQDVVAELDKRETEEAAERIGISFAAAYDTTVDFFSFLPKAIGGATDALARYDQQTAIALKASADSYVEGENSIRNFGAALSDAILNSGNFLGDYLSRVNDITEATQELSEEQERQQRLFENQQALERVGALLGLTAKQAREVGYELGLIDRVAEDVFDVKPIERYDNALAQLQKRFGLIGKEARDAQGNVIDLTRPRLQNQDGSFSTEETFTTEVDGRFLNIPTIFDGERHTIDEAFEAYLSGVNKAVGAFDTLEEAIAAAEARTEEIGDIRLGSKTEDTLSFMLETFTDLPGLIFDTKEAADALAAVGLENVANFFASFQGETEKYAGFLATLQKRVEKLREQNAPENSKVAATIIAGFETDLPKSFADPEKRAAIEALAKEIEALSKANKDAGESFEQLALRARELADLRTLASAATQGPEALERAREEIEIQKELISLEAEARKAGIEFDKAAAEARLRAISDLEHQIDRALEAYDEIIAKQEKIQSGIVDDFSKAADAVQEGAREDRGFVAGSAATRDQALLRQLQKLQELIDQADIDSIGLSPELIEEQQKIIDDTREAIFDAHRDGAIAIEEAIREGARSLTEAILGDLILNGGQGIGAIFERALEDSIRTSFISPIANFLAGDSPTGDLFQDISDGFESTRKTFQRVGEGLDELLGSDFLGGISGEIGAALAGYGVGSGLADVFNGGAGETGSAIGGAVGAAGAAAFGLPPELGAAIGSFFGDIFGGLFGRKTASATFDFANNSVSAKNSTKDSRNEARNSILEGFADASQAIAQIVGARLDASLGLSVNVGKTQTWVQLVDAAGRVLAEGTKVSPDDIAGAVGSAVSLVIDKAFAGGDPLLLQSARAFANVDAGPDFIINSLQAVADALSIGADPISEWLDGINSLTDTFERAIDASRRYGSATQELVDAQRAAIEQFAENYDSNLDEQLRRIQSPILQDALDLAKEQAQRLAEVDAINSALTAPPPSIVTPQFGGVPGRTSNRYLEEFFDFSVFEQQAQMAAAANDNATASAIANAEAQQRLATAMELNLEEWRQFIERAADSPEAMRAVAEALAATRDEFIALGIDIGTVEAALGDLRSRLAADFDQAQLRRDLELSNPIQAQVDDIVAAQLEIIAAAKAVSENAEDERARLERVFAINAKEFSNFIDAANNAPDALFAIVEALDKLNDRADEIGLTVGQINELKIGAIAAGGAAFLQEVESDFRRLTNEPAARFVELLEQQKKLVEAAQGFADLAPDQFGSLPTITRNRNALERQRFLEGLSGEDKIRLGDFVGLIEDYGGRIDVVTTQLRDVLTNVADEVEDRLAELDDTISSESQFAERIADARRSLEEQFFAGSPQEAINSLIDRVTALREAALGGDEEARTKAREDIADVVTQLVQKAAADIGTASTQFSEIREFGLGALRDVEAAALDTVAAAQTERDILEADLEISKQLLASFDEANDNTAYLKDIQAAGEIQNDLTRKLIDELVALRELQANQNVSSISQLINFDGNASALFPVTPDIGVDREAEQLRLLAELVASQQPEQVGSALPQVASNTPGVAAAGADQEDVVIAVGSMETSLYNALKATNVAIQSLKEEIIILRADNAKLNDELKTAINPTRPTLKAAAA